MKVWHTRLNILPTCESTSISYDTFTWKLAALREVIPTGLIPFGSRNAMIPKSASIAIHVYILNSDMKASPTVSDPYPSHPYLSRLRNWPQIVQLSYLFRSMLSLQVQQTLLLAALLLTKIMMMIIRSPKWEIYYLTLWSQLKENWIGGRGWDSSTCKVHLHQSLDMYDFSSTSWSPVLLESSDVPLSCSGPLGYNWSSSNARHL